ncbi:MAG: M50 family metallopeptidase [Anaerolineales bacterium]|nr:M50 family metallopeptidase [Anaerolineales bacterium]
MKKTDLLWILAYPLYQLVGTLRHEASHAAAALLEGARVTEFVFWPTRGYWGYVRWEGSVSAATIGGPYLCDLLTFGVFFILCMTVRFKRRWVWLNAAAVGIISPLVNSFYNYWGGLRGPNDVGKLLERLPPMFVHLYFWLTMGMYLAGLVLVFTWSRTARARMEQERNVV